MPENRKREQRTEGWMDELKSRDQKMPEWGRGFLKVKHVADDGH